MADVDSWFWSHDPNTARRKPKILLVLFPTARAMANKEQKLTSLKNNKEWNPWHWLHRPWHDRDTQKLLRSLRWGPAVGSWNFPVETWEREHMVGHMAHQNGKNRRKWASKWKNGRIRDYFLPPRGCECVLSIFQSLVGVPHFIVPFFRCLCFRRTGNSKMLPCFSSREDEILQVQLLWRLGPVSST